MSLFKKTLISLFVIGWICLFHYESLRHFYLEPLVGHTLPKTKFLFPPAGWIMFFNVDERYGGAQVYGIRSNQPEWIDPHRVFPIRWVGYDNIRRNVLVSVLDERRGRDFCRYLKRKFPEYDEFVVAATYYPSVTRDPATRYRQPVYRCE